MPNSGLDTEKLGLLQRWANGLVDDERQEVAAAGRAILLLIEEVERLHVVLWDLRLYPGVEPSGAPATGAAPAAADGAAEPSAADDGSRDELSTSLTERIRRRLAAPARDDSSMGGGGA